MELARSTDDLMTSVSIEGKHFPAFEMLDAKMASAMRKIIQTTDKTLNLKTSATSNSKNPLLPSGFRVQNGTKIAVHFAPKEEDKKRQYSLKESHDTKELFFAEWVERKRKLETMSCGYDVKRRQSKLKRPTIQRKQKAAEVGRCDNTFPGSRTTHRRREASWKKSYKKVKIKRKTCGHKRRNQSAKLKWTRERRPNCKTASTLGSKYAVSWTQSMKEKSPHEEELQ